MSPVELFRLVFRWVGRVVAPCILTVGLTFIGSAIFLGVELGSVDEAQPCTDVELVRDFSHIEPKERMDACLSVTHGFGMALIVILFIVGFFALIIGGVLTSFAWGLDKKFR